MVFRETNKKTIKKNKLLILISKVLGALIRENAVIVHLSLQGPEKSTRHSCNVICMSQMFFFFNFFLSQLFLSCLPWYLIRKLAKTSMEKSSESASIR